MMIVTAGAAGVRSAVNAQTSMWCFQETLLVK